MASPNIVIERVNNLYERVHRLFAGVYFEIVIENRTPELEPTKRFFINMADMEANIEMNIMALNAHPVVKERLSRIARLQENYKLLMDTAVETLTRVKEEYADAIYKVSLLRRKQEVQFEPVPAFDTDSEEDTDSDWDSDEDWTSDSGLDSETDTQSEFEVGWDVASDVDSGLEHDD